MFCLLWNSVLFLTAILIVNELKADGDGSGNHGSQERISGLHLSHTTPLCADGSPADKCFIISDYKRSWSEAHNFCRSEGGFLPNEDELKEVNRTVIQTLITWSALTYISGCYQWLTRRPSYAHLIPWEEGFNPPVWDSRCPLFNSSSAKFFPIDCSEEHYFACVVTERAPKGPPVPKNFELRLTSNIKDQDGWIEISKDHFENLALKCSVYEHNLGNEITSKINVHWSKDGIWMNHYQPTIDPATVIDIYKSSLLPRNAVDDYRKVVKQGTFCCESWIPFTTVVKKSNCLLVTLKEWATLVLTFRFGITDFLDSNFLPDFNKRFPFYLFDDYMPNLSRLPRSPISISKLHNNNESSYLIKFHVYSLKLPNQQFSLLKLISQDSPYDSIINLRNPRVKLATYCEATKISYKYGNSVTYKFAKAGTRYNIDFKCVTENNKLNYATCRWNYTHGADIVLPSNCNRFDICPRNFSTIQNSLCIKTLLNVSQKEGFNNFYKLGWKFTLDEYSPRRIVSYLDQHVIDYLLDLNVQSIWLPMKRRYDKTPITGFVRHRYDALLTEKGYYSWKDGHPKADKRCVALELKKKTFYSLDCDERNNALILLVPHSTSQPQRNRRYSRLVQFNGTWKSNNTYYTIPTSNKMIYYSDLKNERWPLPLCKPEWNEISTLDGTKRCFKNFFIHNLTWINANKFCESLNASLFSPQLGFRNWAYRSHLVGSSWIKIEYENILNNIQFDYVNWLPTTNFSKKYGVMSRDGWFLADGDEVQNNVICEKETERTYFPEISIQRNYPGKVLCIKTYNLNPYISPKCFENGIERSDLLREVGNCPFVLPIAGQGQYECKMWSDTTNKYIWSNTYLHIENSIDSFVVVGLNRNSIYNPLIYDSTFNSPENPRFPENSCVLTLQQTFLNNNKKLNISKVFFFQRNNLFHYSFILECQNGMTSFCTSEKNILKNLNRIFHELNLDNVCVIEEVRSATGCPRELTKDEFNDQTLTWPQTKRKGNVVPEEHCIDENGELVSRICYGSFIEGYYWKEAPSGCPGKASDRTVNIWKISTDPYGYINGKYNTLAGLTANGKSINQADFYYVVKSFEMLSKNQNFSKQVKFEEITTTISNMLDVSNKVFTSTYELFNSSAILLDSFEKLAFASNGKSNRKSISKKWIIADCIDVSSDMKVIGYRANPQKGNLLTENKFQVINTTVAIVLPDGLSQAVVAAHEDKSLPPQRTELLFVVYKNDKLFYDPESTSLGFQVNSKIIQASYEQGIIKDLNETIKTFFRPKRNHSEVKCVYWNFEKNKMKGGWSDIGCELVAVDEHFVTCECNHLTAFSLLIKYTESPDYTKHHNLILHFISVIGCSLSIFGLTMVLVTFLLFRKWRESLGNKILANLSLAILCSLLIFLVGIELTSNPWLCRCVAISLHYFILASFAWMLVEGVHQYLRFVKVLGAYIPRFLLKAAICAWGIPFILVVVAIAINLELYDDGTQSDICWMSSELFIYFFVPLVGLVIITNAIIFIIIFVSVTVKSKNETVLRSTLSEKSRRYRYLSMAVCVFVLLGFTWIFGLLAISNTTLVFSYLFCIFNTMQGFSIFIFHLCRDQTTRELWKNFLDIVKCPSATKLFSESQTNSTIREFEMKVN